MTASSDPKTRLPESSAAADVPQDRSELQPIIETQALGVSYGSLRALDDVNLSIACREITAITGPSGCGKSTFLHTLNRLTDLVPNCRVDGSIRIDGREITSKSCDLLQLRRQVGMVFQKPNPLPLSIRKNFSLPLREHRIAASEIEGRTEFALRDVGLWDEVKDRLNAPAMELSGGQQQRLCIARALALQPDIILFDEPCSALDPNASAVVEDLIVSLRGRLTVVIVTHNIAQARRVADHLVLFWLKDGHGVVLDHGPARRVFDAPANKLTADYLDGSRG